MTRAGRGVPAEPRGRQKSTAGFPGNALKEPRPRQKRRDRSRGPASPRSRASSVRARLTTRARRAPRAAEPRRHRRDARGGSAARGRDPTRTAPRESQPLRGRRIIMRRANHLTGSDSILGRFIRPSRTHTRQTARSEQPCRSVGFYPLLMTNRRNHRSKSTAGVSPIDQGTGHHQNRRASRQSPPRKRFRHLPRSPRVRSDARGTTTNASFASRPRIGPRLAR